VAECLGTVHGRETQVVSLTYCSNALGDRDANTEVIDGGQEQAIAAVFGKTRGKEANKLGT
jgi:hypothetical protein